MMPEFLQNLRDRIVDKLSQTEGQGLEVTTRIINEKQMGLYVESMALEHLGSEYAIERSNKMMRLSCSWQGASRTELVDIGKTPEFKKGDMNAQDF